MSLLTYEQAEALAVAWINDHCGRDQAVVMPEHTIAKPYGWVFFYQSRTYVQTGDDAHFLLVNAPLIVDREDGRVHVTGTARPVEHYLSEFEASRTRQNPACSGPEPRV